MRRILVVANQTLGGDELTGLIRDRLADESCHFHVLVPQTRAADLVRSWVPPDPGLAAELHAQMQADADAEARRHAEARLAKVLGDIQAAGGEADGELGAPDPLEAVCAVLERDTYDEVIISTLPSRVSRWLRMDLPSRIDRGYAVPVTTVVGED